MRSWKDLDIGSRHLVILAPSFFLFMFVNAGIYQAIHNACPAAEDNTQDYFEAFAYLQTVAFTVGYGHISPMCHAGKIYTFFFAYLTIPVVVYIISLSGRKIADQVSSLGSNFLKGVASPFLRNLLTMLLLDLFIFIFMMVIPASIVDGLEPCISYGDSLWYVFQSVTTIGFGDVIAGLDWNDCDAKDVTQNLHHQNNFYWFAKACFLLVALSFMASTWLIKYQIVLDHIYEPNPSGSGRKKLYDKASANDGIEAVDINAT